MKIILSLIFSVFLLSPNELFSQRKKKDFKKVNISASINYNPPSKEFLTDNSITISDTDLLLEYLTASSGVFEVGTETTRLRVDTTRLFTPIQRLGLGFSYQIIKNHTSYKEIAINQLSYANSEKVKAYDYYDENGEYITTAVYGEVVNSFAISMRFETGRYFGDLNKIQLGFGIGLQTGYRYHKDTPYRFIFFPIITHIIDLDIYASLSINKKLSDLFSIEFKVLPGVATAPYTSVRQINPNISLNSQNFNSDNRFPSIKTSASLHFKYTIKDSSKRRRN